MAVFDFASRPDRLGEQLADSVRLKLARHEEYEVIDLLTMHEAGAVGIDAGEAKVAELLKDKIGATIGLYGTVSQSGQTVRAEIGCVDLSSGQARTWKKTFADDTERARGLISQQVVEELRQQPQWRPPEYEEQPEPKDFGQPVNVNGSFDAGGKGWQAPDRASSFLEAGPQGRGGILRIVTDLERDKWLEYQRQLRLGRTDPSKAPRLEKDTGYMSVAGLEGVHFLSDWIEAAPGQRYWLTADMKGKTADIFFPKIFVKGYADWSARADGLPEVSLAQRKLTPADFAAMPKDERKDLIARDARQHPDRYRREVYRWYLACRDEADQWQHYTAPFPPRGGLPKDVQWLQIQVYAYWPPGTFLFDNVQMYKDPAQKAPLPEEKAATPNFQRKKEDVEKSFTQPAK